jgi:hypothetical protein
LGPTGFIRKYNMPEEAAAGRHALHMQHPDIPYTAFQQLRNVIDLS